MKAYGISKLCNVMFTHELAKRTKGTNISTNSLHPGVVRTQLAEEASWLMKLFYWIGAPYAITAIRRRDQYLPGYF
ncbi:MAG: SDR family NAD(P)-dependent oxidoreductase [Fodinibius sp.]|nr:SDR family NAD(P)-dependent oxidoreductase [Fodinibius sp.]